MIGDSSDDSVEDEPFSIELANELIAETEQAPGVDIVCRDENISE